MELPDGCDTDVGSQTRALAPVLHTWHWCLAVFCLFLHVKVLFILLILSKEEGSEKLS